MTRGHNIQGMNRPYFFCCEFTHMHVTSIYMLHLGYTYVERLLAFGYLWNIYIYIPILSLASFLRNHVNDCLIYSVI